MTFLKAPGRYWDLATKPLTPENHPCLQVTPPWEKIQIPQELAGARGYLQKCLHMLRKGSRGSQAETDALSKRHLTTAVSLSLIAFLESLCDLPVRHVAFPKKALSSSQHIFQTA